MRVTLLDLDLSELEDERVELEKRRGELAVIDADLRKQAMASQTGGPRKIVVHEEKSSVTAEREENEQKLAEVKLRLDLTNSKIGEMEGQRRTMEEAWPVLSLHTTTV